jgi:hypothetical protein
MIRSALAAAAVLLAASSAQATLLGSFEGNLSGPLGTWSYTNGTSGTFSSTVGVTEGTQSAAITVVPNFNWAMALNGNEPLRDAILANDLIAFDVTIETPYTPGVAEYMVFFASLNSEGTGWQQTAANLRPLGGGSDNAMGTTKVTFVWDYPQTAMNATSAWAQFNLATNFGPASGTVPTMHIDNFRLIPIPEPTSLGALALGGLVALRRRRA